MSREFSDALNDCIDRMLRGEDARSCLERYPEHAADLEPLLEVSLATIRVAREARPDPAAKSRGFERFSKAVAAQSAAAARQPNGASAQLTARLRSWLEWRWTLVARPVAFALVALLAFAAGGGVAVAASSTAVPGEPLYWVKTTRENIESRLPRSADSRAIYEAELARTRSDEVGRLIERGSFTEASRAVRRINDHFTKSARLAGITTAADPVEMPFKPRIHMTRSAAVQLKTMLYSDREELRGKAVIILTRLDPNDQKRAKRFFRSAELGYWLMIDAMEEEPSDILWRHKMKSHHNVDHRR